MGRVRESVSRGAPGLVDKASSVIVIVLGLIVQRSVSHRGLTLE